MTKSYTAWGGFIVGKLDWAHGHYVTGEIRWIPAIFKTRKEARAQYEDVRKISIREFRFYG